ncbi:sugar ABC transporter permease [Mahella sp.]|uniref:carbohydrate ABC transporter permease n=1 Tax=Mahella sp. TaxID=2798721 RepID=UPI0025C69B11|nr:sugar ABC transporter permease [Mahella sp.]MBZ4665958.1 ABC-type transporter, integral rane subunit [Mahella sp.]
MKRKNSGDGWAAYAYLSPALISIAILSLFPIGYTVYIAFTNFNLNHFKNYEFVGFANFKYVITGPFKEIFLSVFLWTLAFAVLSTILCYVVGLILAVLLNNKNMWETNIYRAILIIPWALPGTIAVLAWSGLLNETYGGLNMILSMLNISPRPWMTDPNWARAGIIIANLWLGYPFMMNVCLGGLQAIPPEMYEVADLDGATWWQKLTRITIPMIMPSSLPLLVSTFAYNFNNFGTAYLIMQGMPPRPDTQFAGYTDILLTSSYKMTMQFNRYDLGAALSVIIFLIVAVISIINMRATHAFEEVD